MLRQFKRLATHSTIYGLSNILNTALAFILIPLYTHRLSPEDFGVITVITITATFAATLFQLGTGTAIFRSVIQRHVEKSLVFSTAFYFTLAIIIIFLGIFWILSASLLEHWLIPNIPRGNVYIFFAFVAAALDTIATIPLAKLRIEERSITYSVLSVCNFSIGLILNFFFVAYLHLKVQGIITANLIRSALYVAMTMVTLLPDLKTVFSLSELRELISFGLPLIPIAICGLILSVADRYFLQCYASLHDVGIYSLGYKIGSLLQLPIGAFQTAWPTIMFAVYNTSNAKSFYARVLTYFCFILGYLALIIASFSKEIINLIATPDYSAAWQIVLIVAVSQIMLGIVYVTAIGVNVKKRPQDIMFAWLVGVFIHITLNFILIPTYGMYGAALSTLVGYTIVTFGAAIASLRLYPIRYEYLRLVKLSVAIICIYLACMAIPSDPIGINWIRKSLLILSLPIVLWFMKFFHQDEINAVKIRIHSMIQAGNTQKHT